MSCSHLVAASAAGACALCRTALTGLTVMLPVALLMPALSLFPPSHAAAMICAFAALYSAYNVGVNFTFASSNVLVNETAMTPELKDQVGSINGAGATLAAATRSFGPAVTGWLWSRATSSGLPGAQFALWWAFTLLLLFNMAMIARA